MILLSVPSGSRSSVRRFLIYSFGLLDRGRALLRVRLRPRRLRVIAVWRWRGLAQLWIEHGITTLGGVGCDSEKENQGNYCSAIESNSGLHNTAPWMITKPAGSLKNAFLLDSVSTTWFGGAVYTTWAA